MPLVHDLPTLSVVVPTYQRHAQIIGTVEALLAEPDLHELVVAVDGPDPVLEKRLDRVQDARLVVVVLPENVGQSAARYAGARAATGEVILLIDDDVALEPGAVGGHVLHHAQDNDLVVVGHNPVALPPRRRPGMAATYLYAAEYDRAWADLLADESLVLERLWAGHVSVRRDAYLDVAGYEWPVRYHEDQDLGRRLGEAGLRGRAAPDIRSRHHHSRSVSQAVEESRRQGEALGLLARRWPNSPTPDYATRPGPIGRTRLGSTGNAGQIIVAMARSLAGLAGRLHLWALETAALRLARQLALRRSLGDAVVRP